jgi:hypothetical protein
MAVAAHIIPLNTVHHVLLDAVPQPAGCVFAEVVRGAGFISVTASLGRSSGVGIGSFFSASASRRHRTESDVIVMTRWFVALIGAVAATGMHAESASECSSAPFLR